MATMPLTAPTAPRPLLLARWLWLVAAMVVAIVIIGGITRLTESGLSITEWKPLMGTLPPLTAADWQAEFEKYKQIPEYQQINRGMSLAEFQYIYFWEWLHRLWGRLIGAAMAVPWLWFALRGWIPQGYTPRLIAILALVGFQGAIGWWMVASGLEVRTDVSHFRLSAHLLTALLILGGLVWTARDLQILGRTGVDRPARLTPYGIWAAIALTLQLLLGAWTAGLNAGQVASTWPLMNDYIMPLGVDWSRGMIFAFTHDPFLIHFMHRWWAWVAAAALIGLAIRAGHAGGKREAALLLWLVLGQVILGIATVMSGVALWIAVAHQAIGALLVLAMVLALHRTGSQA